MMLALQLLVLAFTALLWALARRDLGARKPPSAPPALDMAEWQRLHAMVEAVLVNLESRIDALERQLVALPRAPELSEAELRPGKRDLLLPEDAHYTPLYALTDAGITDADEIARRTGLTRGEVELALSLRARRML